jgi:predicted transcriptional regulator
MDSLDELILKCVNERPGLNQLEMARALGIKPGTLRYRLLDLQYKGLLTISRCRNATKVYPVYSAKKV